MRASSFQWHRAVLTGRRPEGSLFMAMDTMPSALHVAFRTALLLTGDTRTAEAAVMHGIDVCEDLSPGGLLIAAVRSAVRRRTKSSDGPYEVECLPPELRRHQPRAIGLRATCGERWTWSCMARCNATCVPAVAPRGAAFRAGLLFRSAFRQVFPDQQMSIRGKSKRPTQLPTHECTFGT